MSTTSVGPARVATPPTCRCCRAPTGRSGWTPSTRSSRRCFEAFAPDVLVTQLGADTHLEDPLAHLALRVDDQAAAVHRLHELAHEVDRGPMGGHRWRRLLTGPGRAALLDRRLRGDVRAVACPTPSPSSGSSSLPPNSAAGRRRRSPTRGSRSTPRPVVGPSRRRRRPRQLSVTSSCRGTGRPGDGGVRARCARRGWLAGPRRASRTLPNRGTAPATRPCRPADGR